MLPKNEKQNKLMVVCNGMMESGCRLVDEDTKEQKSPSNFVVNNKLGATFS